VNGRPICTKCPVLHAKPGVLAGFSDVGGLATRCFASLEREGMGVCLREAGKLGPPGLVDLGAPPPGGTPGAPSFDVCGRAGAQGKSSPVRAFANGPMGSSRAALEWHAGSLHC
jgi:hypothetical protein